MKVPRPNHPAQRTKLHEIPSNFYVISVQFSTDVYQRIQEAIDQLSSIACLVNNVGMGPPKFDYYATTDYMSINFIKNIVFCNTLPIAMMTHLVLPKMLKQSTTDMAIINIGSYSGVEQETFGYMGHAIQAYINSFLPNSFLRYYMLLMRWWIIKHKLH
ncbi:unnamed protein product [Schistosoma mattheei]|uniref:Uncharacterized protein n=1 Tax=Schistosoma mattheei TaxID=31246 RepID=A0A183PQ95_9TREM|nr:unnamed protein product [Schistosoma mattheei]